MFSPTSLHYLAAGALLVGMALSGSLVKRLPLSAAMFYLGAGYLLGPAGAGLITVDLFHFPGWVERFTELAVILSLFGAGLKLRRPPADRRWLLPLLLATASMLLTVGMIAAMGRMWLGLNWGGALVLGAVLAPTDPVLASDVQVTDPADRDRVRFSLTGEAGLNDGTAFPLVRLGMVLLGLEGDGSEAAVWAWVGRAAWGTVGALALGLAVGAVVGRAVLRLRRAGGEAEGVDDFLALGLMALSYGAALALDLYAFLAVFASGLALGWLERHPEVADAPPPRELPDKALGFMEQANRIAEVAVVVLLGALLAESGWDWGHWWFVAAVLLLVRPLAVLPVLLPSRADALQTAMIAWFGVRGVGSVYYLAYALAHGYPEESGRRLAALVLTTVAVSVVVHGVSVTPLMNFYAGVRPRRHSTATP